MATYDIGDTVRCSIAFTSGGTAIDPTTVTARINTPARATTAYVYGTDAPLVKDGVGVYHLDVFPSVAGVWTYRFEGTGTAESAVEQTFFVQPSAFY